MRYSAPGNIFSFSAIALELDLLVSLPPQHSIEICLIQFFKLLLLMAGRLK
jgi:hypothetical protein